MLASASSAIARAVASVGRVDRRAGQGLEADEDLGQPGRVEERAELRRDLGRWRQGGVQRPDRRGRLGGLGQARDRPDRQQAAGQPDDEQCLGGAGEPAGDPVRRARGRPSPRARAIIAADGRPERFADPDREEEAGQHDERPQSRPGAVERLDEEGQGEHDDRAAADGAEQATDLGQGPRSEPEQDGEHHQDDGDEVEWVHWRDGRTGRVRACVERPGRRRPGRCGGGRVRRGTSG